MGIMMGLRVTPARRLAFFVGVDATIAVVAVVAAWALRYDLSPPSSAAFAVAFVAGLYAFLTVLTLFALRVYRVSWTLFGLRDIARVAQAGFIVMVVTTAFVQLMHVTKMLEGFPRSVPILAAPVVFCGIAGFRLLKRVRGRSRQAATLRQGLPTIIVGAGHAGAQVLDSIVDSSQRELYHVVGFLDDDPLTHKTSIRGVSVLGAVSSLPAHVAARDVRVVIVCVATATSPFVRNVVQLAKSAGVHTLRIIPPLHQIVDGHVSVQATRDVSLEDLLGRELVEIDARDVLGIIQGKRVVVTGGAGTIGSELCRQLARLSPALLVVLDTDESRLHETTEEIKSLHPGLAVVEALVDVRDRPALEAVFRGGVGLVPQNEDDTTRPSGRVGVDVVFHAAAYKHVPMMERWPISALDVNVLGTTNVAEFAEAAGCSRFVLVSTDKAVEPSSVMGASKRLAELAVLSTSGTMTRSIVRFGNVIGSRGSVIPTFERQLREGGPLTVTHPDMERFFMMTSEAVSLVLQAAALGRGRNIFVLEMGQPVRILDVAREFIRLHGLEPDVDIPIVFTGLRRGEKLVEILHHADEILLPTTHSRIARIDAEASESNDKILQEVQTIVASRDVSQARRFLESVFPSLREARA